MKVEISRLIQENEESASETTILKSKLHSFNIANQDLQRQLETLSKENEDLQKEMEEKIAEISRTENEHGRLKAHLKNLSHNLDELKVCYFFE